MSSITPFQLAMGLGAAGAMVDISTYVSLGDTVGRSWGAPDEFRDTVPEQFDFTLFNSDGRFTPDNVSSPYATTVTEGMPVCWNLGGRLIAGSILAIEFSSTETSWGQIHITCDDMLGSAGRKLLTGLAESLVWAADPYLFWPLTDPQGSLTAPLEMVLGLPTPSNPPLGKYGVSGVPAVGQTQVEESNAEVSLTAADVLIAYPVGSLGVWGCWVTMMTAGGTAQLDIAIEGLPEVTPFTVGVNGGQLYMRAGSNSVTANVTPVVGVAYYVAIGLVPSGTTSIAATFYLNGVSQGSTTYVPSGGGPGGLLTTGPQYVSASLDTGGSYTARFSHVSHTPALVHEEWAGETTEAQRLTALAQIAPEITLDTLPSDLSTATIGFQDTTQGTLLTALNTIIMGEQGHIYTSTSGSLLAPVQKLSVKARQRPYTATHTFDAALDLSAVPQFVRDITNMVSSVAVQGAGVSTVVTDPTVTGRAKSATVSATIANDQFIDLQYWGQDRIVRGKNVNLRVVSVTVDAYSTSTDRSAELLAMLPGDRIHITGLPSTQLGFTTWDGWLIGGKETHSLGQDSFEMILAPVILEGIFDTSEFMADGALTLAAAIGATDTSMSVSTTGPLLETGTFPYTLLIDSEQVTVTACTTATPQVATITRGVNGTTATTHSTVTVEIVPSSLFAF